MRTQLVTAITSLIVLVALCFSVGEGLRLTPFPPSALTQVEKTDREMGAHASHKISLYRYGPLDVPAHNQMRNKRQAIDFVCPPPGISRKLPALLYRALDQQPAHVVSALFVSRPAGRAPPSVS